MKIAVGVIVAVVAVLVAGGLSIALLVAVLIKKERLEHPEGMCIIIYINTYILHTYTTGL